MLILCDYESVRMRDHRRQLLEQSRLVIKQRNLGLVIVFRSGLDDLGLRLVQLCLTQLDD